MACTYGYAVTQSSARALMGFMLDLDRALDEAMSLFCVTHDCLVVWPELVASHRQPLSPVGNHDRDSDTGNSHDNDNTPPTGFTRNVENSAIVAALEKWSDHGLWQR